MNPLFQLLQAPQSLSNQSNLKQMYQLIKASQNPLEALTSQCGNNPMLSNVLQMCQGKDPKEVFYQECQKRGINPDDILNQLK